MTEENNKSLGRKVLEEVEYALKNSLNILPFRSLKNYENKVKKLGKEDYKKLPWVTGDLDFKALFHRMYSLASIVVPVIYLSSGIFDGTWTPKQFRDYKIETQYQEALVENEKILWGQKNPLKDAKNLQDSLDIYQKYGLPIILKEPSLDEKNKILENLAD